MIVLIEVYCTIAFCLVSIIHHLSSPNLLLLKCYELTAPLNPDAKITACLNPKEDILQISIGINIRNRIGGEKEWHVSKHENDLHSPVVSYGSRL